MNSYLTFAHYDDPRDGIGTETFYLPNNTEAERYARSLAPDIYSQKRRLDLAYVTLRFTVLVPFRDMKSWRMATDVDKGTILGLPMRVVDGLDEPMIAFPLKRMDMP